MRLAYGASATHSGNDLQITKDTNPIASDNNTAQPVTWHNILIEPLPYSGERITCATVSTTDNQDYIILPTINPELLTRELIGIQGMIEHIVNSLHSHLTTEKLDTCLLYTSPSPRDQRGSRMPSSA